MEQNIKNFIEEGENLKEEFVELYDNNDIPVDKDIVNHPDRIADWWLDKFSSRQISLIKMIVEEIVNKVEVKVYDERISEDVIDIVEKIVKVTKDIITSKLTNIIKE